MDGEVRSYSAIYSGSKPIFIWQSLSFPGSTPGKVYKSAVKKGRFRTGAARPCPAAPSFPFPVPGPGGLLFSNNHDLHRAFTGPGLVEIDEIDEAEFPEVEAAAVDHYGFAAAHD